MKMTAAVMFEQGLKRPFAETKPLKIERVDLDGPGEGEVLVEIVAAGLCHSDLSAIKGVRPRAMPAVVGHEAAGIVREVGKGVKTVAVGDHVVMVFVASCGTCSYCSSGRPNLCESSWKARSEGTLQSGARHISLNGKPLNHYSGISAFAEYAVVSEQSLVPISKLVPLADAAIFGCAVITGVGAVLNSAGDVSGRTLGIVGLGGIGLSALLGAVVGKAGRVIAIDVHEEKLQLARQFGATDVFSAADPDCAQKVREATKGGVDIAFEMAGSIAAMRLAYAIGRRGSTTICAGLPPTTATFDYVPSSLVADERVIKGSYMGSCVPRRDIPKYVDYYLSGQLPVDKLRTHEIGFQEINLAFDRLDDGIGVRQVLMCSARTSAT
jgi:alcohol dehydrogenase